MLHLIQQVKKKTKQNLITQLFTGRVLLNISLDLKMPHLTDDLDGCHQSLADVPLDVVHHHVAARHHPPHPPGLSTHLRPSLHHLLILPILLLQLLKLSDAPLDVCNLKKQFKIVVPDFVYDSSQSVQIHQRKLGLMP